MNPIDRFDRELPTALLDVAGTPATDYLTDILGRTARTRQRPAWASLERWLPMDLATPRAATARVPWRTIGVVALVALMLAALLAVYAGSQRRVPAPFGPAANGLIPFERDLDIYTGDPATGATNLLVAGATNDYGPTFSPDGTSIAFLRAGLDCPDPASDCPGGEDVVVVAPDGTGARAINPQPLVGIGYVAWAPDSRALYVAQGAYGVNRLVRLPVDGTGPQELVAGLTVDWIVVRPPTGDELLVRGFIDGTFGLYAIRADGSHIRLLAGGNIPGEGLNNNQDLNFPSYSPDGSRIYYNRSVAAMDTIQAWVMDADGSNQHRFNPDGPKDGSWEGEMLPSPDGKWIVLWQVQPGGPNRIARYPADGSGHGQTIGPEIRGTAHWSWAPDSSHILVNPNDASEGGQVLIDPADGSWTAVPWAVNAEPDWQRVAP